MINTEKNDPRVDLKEDLRDNSSGSTYQITDQTSSLPRRNIVTIFLSCGVIDLAVLIDQNALAVALPRVSTALGASSQASWIAVAYFITATSFQLLYGRLSDIWSRKIVLLAGIAIFLIGSFASSLATNIIQLIIFRAFSGIGGGGLVTVAQIIVGDVVSLRERGRWHGILGSVVLFSNGIGPLIGGAISSQSENSWRWVFRLNILTSFIAVGMVVFFMPLKKVEGHWKNKLKAIDFFGAALTLMGSAFFMLGLTWGGVTFPWLSLHVTLSLSLGGLLMLGFLLWQWKGAKLPLVPLSMYKSRVVCSGSIVTFITGWNFLMMIYFVPRFYQLAYGYTPVRAATMLLPIILTQTISSTLSGLIIRWRGRYRENIIFGYAIWGIGLGLFSSLNSNSSMAQQVIYAILSGLGAGQTFQPSLIAIQSAVVSEDMAVVTGVRSFLRDLGSTFGLAVSGSIINTSLRGILHSYTANGQLDLSSKQIDLILRDPTLIKSLEKITTSQNAEIVKSLFLSSYFGAFRRVFYVGTALSIFAMIVAIFFIPQLELGEKGLREEIEREKNNDFVKE